MTGRGGGVKKGVFPPVARIKDNAYVIRLILGARRVDHEYTAIGPNHSLII